jgi:hypothetical protein
VNTDTNTDTNRDFESEFDVDFDGELPDSIDEAAIRRMRGVVRVLDEFVRVPGTDIKIGLDPLVGAIPVAGDVVSAGVSLYVVAEAARLGVSYSTLLRMLANVTIDVAGGAIPYVGPLFDAVWKANKYNLVLALEDLASEPETSEEHEVTEIEIR